MKTIELLCSGAQVAQWIGESNQSEGPGFNPQPGLVTRQFFINCFPCYDEYKLKPSLGMPC